MTGHFDFESLSLDRLQQRPGQKWHRYPGAIAAWVADMDFPIAPVVRDALQSALDAGDVGYPDWESTSPALNTFVERCARRYHWSPPIEECREMNDVVQSIQVVLHLATRPGDRVVVHTPAYPPFLHSVEDTGRQLVRVPAQRTPDGWTFDHVALDAELTARPAKVLLLCHPHNPTGHVFGTAELRELADLAERHNLLIISDEIHADLTYAPAHHQPIALFAPQRCITIHSASKAFNLAGLRYAVLHLGASWVRERFDALPDHLFGVTNLMGSVAANAAWRHGDEWLSAVVAHLDSQRHLLADLLRSSLPQVGYVAPEATYLAWLDCAALDLGIDPSVEFARRGVKLSDGPAFGAEGNYFARLNFATSSGLLRSMVAAMAG